MRLGPQKFEMTALGSESSVEGSLSATRLGRTGAYLRHLGVILGIFRIQQFENSEGTTRLCK